MVHIEIENKTILLMLIDFEKAFDSVSCGFLDKALNFHNFGPDIPRWISIFITKIKAYILQCGHLSEYFYIKRSCKLGDPLSLHIFILCAE